MQEDMHYYGTYAMARAAGIKSEAAYIIAYSAQFVDDNVAENALEFEDGSRIDCEATAHHVTNRKNLSDPDQRRVWVPFHFFPGNSGTTYRERMKCRKNSELANMMIDYHLQFSNREFACQLMGIGAHVYADTFSHYGFSGISSRGNGIDQNTIIIDKDLDPQIKNYIEDKAVSFFKDHVDSCKLENSKSRFLKNSKPRFSVNIMAWFAEKLSGALGHGSVATYPDRPYLKWKFRYDEDDCEAENCWSERDNPETFLEGCRSLHAVFKRFAQANGGKHDAGDGRDFPNIENSVKNVLATQDNKEGRINAWKNGAKNGQLFGDQNGESIPDYNDKIWNKEWQSFDKQENCDQAIKSEIWQFYRAAAIHRTYVLRDLLPNHGLVVD